MTATKRCTKCKTVRSLSDFPTDRSRPDNKHSWCKFCKTKQDNLWKRKKRIEDPVYRSRMNKIARNKSILNYGISYEEYEEMLIDQEGVCAICGCEETNNTRGKINRLCIDHNHDSGEVRGLLCHKCNVGIGNLKEDIDILINAIKYLNKNNHGGG